MQNCKNCNSEKVTNEIVFANNKSYFLCKLCFEEYEQHQQKIKNDVLVKYPHF